MRGVLGGLLALLSFAAIGCNGFTRSGETIVSGQKWSYESAHLVYCRQLNGSPQNPQAARLRTLTVAYPHPAGKAGYARVELVEESVLPAGASAAETDDSWLARVRRTTRDFLPGVRLADGISGAWALDVRIGRVNRLLYDLDQQGYFGAAAPAVPEVSLAATVNGVPFERPWKQVPQLESLAAQVRQEGSVVSHGERSDELSLVASLPRGTWTPPAIASGPAAPPPSAGPCLLPAEYSMVPAAYHAPTGDENAVTPLPPVEPGL